MAHGVYLFAFDMCFSGYFNLIVFVLSTMLW